MTALAERLTKRSEQLTLLGLLFAAGAGAAVAAGVGPAVLVAAAVVAGAALLRRPSFVLVLLLSAMFLEIVTVGGLTIGRVVAPVALLLAGIALLRGERRLCFGISATWAGA